MHSFLAALGLSVRLFVSMASPVEPPTYSDRPDVTNGTHIVPTGAWQMEVGLDAELAQRQADASPLGIESTLRIGIHEDVELRLLEGDLHEWIVAARDEDGSFVAGSTLRATTRALDEVPLLEFSAKVRLTDEDIRRFIPSLGIQPLIAFRPPGEAYRGVPVFGLVFIVSQPFGPYTLLDMNAALRVDGNLTREKIVSGYVSASIGVQPHHRVLFYAELLTVLAANREELLISDAGLLLTAHSRVIFDISGRVTLVGSYRTAGVAVGMTAMLATGERVRRWLAERPTRPKR